MTTSTTTSRTRTAELDRLFAPRTWTTDLFAAMDVATGPSKSSRP